MNRHKLRHLYTKAVPVHSLRSISYKSLFDTNLEYLEQNLPVQVYIDYLEFMISDYQFYEKFTTEYDFGNLFNKNVWLNPTITHSYAIKNFMEYYIEMFATPNKNVAVHVLGYGNDQSGICARCNRMNYKCFSYNRIVKLANVVENFCKDNKFWCAQCKIVPLFYFNIE